jgi:hypothetical protein
MPKLGFFSISFSRFLVIAWSVSLVLGLSGCDSREQIVVHRIPKIKPASKQVASNDRMLVAISLHQTDAWFFKMVGKAELIDAQAVAFQAALETLEFDTAGNPVWKTPSDWQKIPSPSNTRFATYQVGASPEAPTIAVSKLGFGGDKQDYLAININRWRREMGLQELPAAEASRSAPLIKGKDSSAETYLLDLKGAFNGGAMGGMKGGPFAGGSRPGSGPTGTGDATIDSAHGVDSSASVPTPPSNSGDTKQTASDPGAPIDIQYEAPAGWSKSPPAPFSFLSFSVESEGETGKVSLSPLDPNNQWDSNVQRWADQVGAGELTAESIAGLTREVTVSGVTGKQIEISHESTGQAINGVMVVHDNVAWFIKLSGSQKLVEKQRPAFDQFLSSLKLPTAK